MEVEVLSVSGKHLTTLEVAASASILDVKRAYSAVKPGVYPERQAYRVNAKAKNLKDNDSLAALGFKTSAKLYFKDLGPQIGYTTVSAFDIYAKWTNLLHASIALLVLTMSRLLTLP